MPRVKGYPRSWKDRQGQVNPRVDISTHVDRYTTRNESAQRKALLRPWIQELEKDPEPDCIIFVTKRIGFGATEQKESQPTSWRGVGLLMQSFPPEQFARYLVKIRLKDKR